MQRWRGMTLIELMLALIVVALLGSIALPSYRSYIDRSRTSQAVTDIKRIEMNIERYVTDRGRYPPTLADLGGTAPVDPWGQPYRYLRMEGASVGQVRKDHALHPLNTDYDLYSIGPDGRTASPLTAAISRDDIVRARNGSFVGLASTY
jgi:general secretion pathway protein G